MGTTVDILVVDDEPALRAMLGMALRRAGFEFREAGDAAAAKAAILERMPDLVLLDWMLPGRPGIDLVRDLRQMEAFKSLPIIMLTARVEERDRVHGLDIGADDFVMKPFSMSELIARVRAVLRRTATIHSTSAIEVNGLRLDPEAHRVSAHGHPISLSSTEFRLLHFFMSHTNRVQNRNQIIDGVWGSNAYVGDRTVDVHVRSLRKALTPTGHDTLVQTVRGSGYRFSAQD